MNVPHTARSIQRVRHEIQFREVEVADVHQISPHFVSVTFTGESLGNFVSLSFDDHVKFIFPTPQEGVVRRDYTPRHFDAAARTLTLEFALHEHGPASDWAAQARIGQKVTVAGPRGSRIIPLDYDWHLLVGDLSALPAIHRRLDELPSGARVAVRILAPDAADRRDFTSAAALDVEWAATDDALIAALRRLPESQGEGFSWGAGEASLMARVRDVLVGEKQQSKDALRIAAYWRRGVADFHEKLAD